MEQRADGPGAHAHARHGRVGHVDHVGPGFSQQRGSGDEFVGGKPTRRIHLHGNHKASGCQFFCQLGRLVRRGGFLFGGYDGMFLRVNCGRIGGVDGLGHILDVLGGGAAAAADQARAGFPEGQGILAKILGRGSIHDAPADLLRPPGVGHDREYAFWHGLTHLLEDAQDLMGAARAVDADQISPGSANITGHLGGTVAQQGAVVAGEGHGCDHGQVGSGFAGSLDGFHDLV